MRRNVFGILAAGFGLLLASAPLLAHHSFAAEYDSKKPIKITGTVTKGGMDEPPHLLLCRCKRRQRKGNELRPSRVVPRTLFAETDGERIH